MGTVKRILRKANLQQPDDDQIMIESAADKCYEKNIKNIKFHFIDKKYVSLLLELENDFQ